MTKRDYRGRNYRKIRRKRLIFAICILAVLTVAAGSAAIFLPMPERNTALAQGQEESTEPDSGESVRNVDGTGEAQAGSDEFVGVTQESGTSEPEMTEASTESSVPENTTEAVSEEIPVETEPSAADPSEPEQDPADESPVVPESDPVDDSWFDDAVFIGDSRVEGFRTQSGLSNAQYLAEKGMNVSAVFTEDYIRQGGDKVTVLEALEGMSFSKVYIKLGINELGWYYPEIFIEDYSELIDAIREINPGAAIYVQSIIVVSRDKSDQDEIYNNENISLFNGLLLDMAQEKGVHYLDLNEVLADEDGYLPEDASFDGVHLKPDYCKIWLDYLKTHTVQD